MAKFAKIFSLISAKQTRETPTDKEMVKIKNPTKYQQRCLKDCLIYSVDSKKQHTILWWILKLSHQFLKQTLFIWGSHTEKSSQYKQPKRSQSTWRYCNLEVPYLPVRSCCLWLLVNMDVVFRLVNKSKHWGLIDWIKYYILHYSNLSTNNHNKNNINLAKCSENIVFIYK